MKKIIATLFALFMIAAVFSSCDTQHRCAAYEHYSYNMPANDGNQGE